MLLLFSNILAMAEETPPDRYKILSKLMMKERKFDKADFEEFKQLFIEKCCKEILKIARSLDQNLGLTKEIGLINYPMTVKEIKKTNEMNDKPHYFLRVVGPSSMKEFSKEWPISYKIISGPNGSSHLVITHHKNPPVNEYDIGIMCNDFERLLANKELPFIAHPAINNILYWKK